VEQPVAGRAKNTATSFFFGSFFITEKKKEHAPQYYSVVL
jgi:hypothetical protein